MDRLIELLQLPIVSGVIVPLLSFAFGYFLFRAQRHEEARLEVFRRRLNAYEKVSVFLQEIDTFAHQKAWDSSKPLSADLIAERGSLVQNCFNLAYSVRLYLPIDVANVLENLALEIDDLPESLATVESSVGDIGGMIDKEVGKYIDNWYVEIREIIKKNTGQYIPTGKLPK